MRHLRVLLLAAAALLVGACMPPPPPVFIVVRRAPQPMRVPAPPPAPRQEEPAPPPDASYVWAPGYWHYNGGDYDWVGGQWLPPRDGYDFVPALYSFVAGAWLYRPCFWRPRNRGGVIAGGGARRRHPRTGGIPSGTHPASPSINPGPNRVRRPAPPAGRTRKPAPTVARMRKPAPGVTGVGGIEQNTRRAQANSRTVVLEHGSRVASVQPSRAGRVDPAKLRKRREYQGSHSGRMAFGNTSGRGYMLRGVRYKTDHTGAIVLGGGARGRVRLRGGSGVYHRAGGGRLTVVAANSRIEGVERSRKRDRRFSATANARQARHRRALLSNPNWRPRRGGVVYQPRTSHSARGLRSARNGGDRSYRGGRTYRTRPYRGHTARPSYRGRTYTPNRSAYRPQRRYRGSYQTRQRVYRAPMRRSSATRSYRRAPARSYRRSSSSSSRSYRRSSSSSRSYRRSSGASRSRSSSSRRRR